MQSQPLDNKGPTPQPQPSTEFLETLKYEMALTAETLNHELSQLAVIGYLEALTGMTPEQVRAGFQRARRTLKWFPKPIEVRELCVSEIEESEPKHYYLPEAFPVWTEEERAAFSKEISKAIKSAHHWMPPEPLTVIPELPTIVEFTNEKREAFEKQKKLLKDKYGF